MKYTSYFNFYGDILCPFFSLLVLLWSELKDCDVYTPIMASRGDRRSHGHDGKARKNSNPSAGSEFVQRYSKEDYSRAIPTSVMVVKVSHCFFVF